MHYPPAVEQWRSTVEEFVAPAYVDKFLWVMAGESGGAPDATNRDSGATGLMQVLTNASFSNRPTHEQLLDPRYNIAYAAQQLGASRGDFTAWGDNGARDANGQPFGALATAPYPGDSGGTAILAGLPGVPSWLDPRNLPGVGSATDVIGKLFPFVFPVAGSIAQGGASAPLDAAHSTANAVSAIGRAAIWLLDPRHWIRLFLIACGVGMVGFGVYLYARGDQALSDAQRVTTVAAKAGAE